MNIEACAKILSKYNQTQLNVKKAGLVFQSYLGGLNLAIEGFKELASASLQVAASKNFGLTPDRDFYTRVMEEDTLGRLRPAFQSGDYYLCPDTHKIKTVLPESAMVESPWVHVKRNPEINCRVWHKIWFNLLGILPSPCLNCWKVVVVPESLPQLFALLEVQKLLQRYSKCGVEIRDYVNRNYGGYFYNNSLEEGRERWAEVRQMVDESISPDITVILKRGCTEYERKFGRSDNWENIVTPEQKRFEKDMAPYFSEFGKRKGPQFEDIQLHVKRTWVDFAYSRGDPTYIHYTGGCDLYPKPVEYHVNP